MMKILSFPKTKPTKVPPDTANTLRSIADRIDAGEVEDFIAIYTADENYNYITATSLHEGAALSSVLNAKLMKAILDA